MNYNSQHKFYCGVDLHARTMFTHVLDHKGKTVFEKDLAADPDEFLYAIKPFRKNLVVGCECMFAWNCLWQEVRSQVPTTEAPERRCLRADVMIVASAAVAGCRRFYTHDPGLRRVAVLAGMESPDLPNGPHTLYPEPPAKTATQPLDSAEEGKQLE